MVAAWDALRWLNTAGALVVLVWSAALVLCPMPGVPATVERARTLLIVGTQCVLLGSAGSSLQLLGESPTVALFTNTLAVALLLAWLSWERRGLAGAP